MKPRHRLRFLLLVPGAVGCGISSVGLADREGAGPAGDGGVSVADGALPGPDSGSEGSAQASASCDSGLPSGAVVIPQASGACPSGTTLQILKTSPQAQAGACTCGSCAVSAEPTCAGNDFVWRWGGNASCMNGPASYNVTADNACVQIFASDQTIDVYNRWTRTPVGGACTAPKVADATKVTTTEVRVCIPDPGACPTPATGDRTCIPADPGGAACSGVHSQALVVGDSAAVDCAACACTRTGAACHVEYHGNSSCTDKVYERDADGTCITTGQPSIQRIKVYPTGLVCNTTPGAATASLVNARSLCCTP